MKHKAVLLFLLYNRYLDRSFTTRTFSKMKEGSIRGSILTLVAAVCGSGAMVLPSLAIASGVVAVVLIMILTGLGCYWSHYMLMQRARHHNINNFSNLAEKAGGKPLKYILVFNILGFLFAACLGC